MKHLDTTAALAIIIIVILPAAGCSESTSPARDTRSLSSEPAVPIAVTSSDDGALAAYAGGEIESISEDVVTEPAPTREANLVVSESTDEPSAETTATEETAPTTALELQRVVMARGVENHEPVGGAESFVHDGTALFAFMQVANPSTEDQEIVIRYQHSSGQIVGPVRLNVPAGSRGWRTFTRTYWVRHPGEWTVSVETSDGHSLGQADFTIEHS